jgi:uncharacterized Tic20 family protein
MVHRAGRQHPWTMTASFEHPSLHMPVTAEQRDRAAQHLQTAYADGRITEEEFDRRIGQVLSAANRKELNDAFYGLVEVPSYSQPGPQPGGMYPSTSYGYRPAVRNEGTPGGALAHLSALLFSIAGPGVGYALSKPGTPARKESAKAFNFQMVSLLTLIVGGTLSAVTNWGLINFLMGLATIAWVVLTIIGGVKAARGDDWTNPVKKVVKLEILPEK